jgi:ribonucleoside-diphosphate reductase alpha chain
MEVRLSCEHCRPEVPPELQVKYEEVLDRFESIKKEMVDILVSLHREGIYPSPPEGFRFKLLDERNGKTNAVTVGFGEEAVKFYITAGEFSDGKLGEIFLCANKQGSLVSGLLDTVATLFSLCLQYGVPLQKLIDKFVFTRFEPSGMTQHPQIRQATSIMDYIGKYLDLVYNDGSLQPRITPQQPTNEEDPNGSTERQAEDP